MGKITSRSTPLTQAEVEAFFKEHLPYRHFMLTTHKLITKDKKEYQQVLPEEIKHKINVSCVEASLIACRMFIEFMGLGLKYKPTVHLIPKTEYYPAREDGKFYEVKIIDLGGKFVDINLLSTEDKELLVELCLMGHRATAHLTYNSPNGGDWRKIHSGVELVERLLNENLYTVVTNTSATELAVNGVKQVIGPVGATGSGPFL